MAKEKDDGKALHPVDIACLENVSELTLESWSESALVLTFLTNSRGMACYAGYRRSFMIERENHNMDGRT